MTKRVAIAVLFCMLLVAVAVVRARIMARPEGSITIAMGRVGRKVSPLLCGSCVTWWRQGNGMLEAPMGVLKHPVTFNPVAIARCREMKLPLLRFLTGQTYNWRDGVGPDRPMRYSQPNRKGEPMANDVGTDEFASFCRRVGAEPIFLLPYKATRDFNDDSAPTGEQLAANWVEYCNVNSPGLAYGKAHGWRPTAWSGTDPNKTEKKVPGSYLSTERAPAGYFAWLREYFGHREPYHVKYWEVGNEIYLFRLNRPGLNRSWAVPSSYAAGFVRFARAMKAEDPTVKVGAVAVTSPPANQPEVWNPGVFGEKGAYSAAYKSADFLTLHEYIGPFKPRRFFHAAEYRDLFQSADELEARLAAFNRAYGKPVFITEYNVQYGVFVNPNPQWVPNQHHLKSALALAVAQNGFRRQGIQGACQFLLMDVGAWYQSKEWRMIFEDINSKSRARRNGVTPTFLMLKLYSLYGRGQLAGVTVASQPDLNVICVTPGAHGRIRLFVVNESPSQDHATTIRQSGGASAFGQGVAYTLGSPDGMEANNEGVTPEVSIARHTLTHLGASFTYRFPAHSLTVLDLPRPH